MNADRAFPRPGFDASDDSQGSWDYAWQDGEEVREKVYPGSGRSSNEANPTKEPDIVSLEMVSASRNIRDSAARQVATISKETMSGSFVRLVRRTTRTKIDLLSGLLSISPCVVPASSDLILDRRCVRPGLG